MQHFARLYRRDERQLIGYGRDLHVQARQWIEYAHAVSELPAAFLHRIAFDALGFCLDRKPKSFCIPAKLQGVPATLAIRHQLAQAESGMPLTARIDEAGAGVVVYAGAHRLGVVDPRHADWFGPLLHTGAAVHLLRVIHVQEGHPVQASLALSFLGQAITEFEHQQSVYRVAA